MEYHVIRKGPGGVEEESIHNPYFTFESARRDCQGWIDYDHETKDHMPGEAPTEPDVNVTDGDYTYVIREVESND